MRALFRLLGVASIVGALALLLREFLNRQGADETRAGASPTAPGRSRSGSSGPTREELYEEAQRLKIKGRSKMSKADLARAVEKATKER